MNKDPNDPQRFLEGHEHLTSVEAAALILSEGVTKDPQLAVTISNAQDGVLIGEESLRLDREQRAALTKMMGFPFTIKIRTNKMTVLAKDGSKLKVSVPVFEDEVENGMFTAEEPLNRLVDACEYLKQQWDAKQKEKKNGKKQS